jgi:hypothetical protein
MGEIGRIEIMLNAATSVVSGFREIVRDAKIADSFMERAYTGLSGHANHWDRAEGLSEPVSALAEQGLESSRKPAPLRY